MGVSLILSAMTNRPSNRLILLASVLLLGGVIVFCVLAWCTFYIREEPTCVRYEMKGDGIDEGVRPIIRV